MAGQCFRDLVDLGLIDGVFPCVVPVGRPAIMSQAGGDRFWSNADRSSDSRVRSAQAVRGDHGNPTLDVIAGLACALDVELLVVMQFEEDRPSGGDEHAATKVAASEKVARYLARRPTGEIERALRILEAAFDEPEMGR